MTAPLNRRYSIHGYTHGGLETAVPCLMIAPMHRTIALGFFLLSASALAIMPAEPERHVVIVVWDGMRPDLVSEQNTPMLWKLAREGVTFRNHHAAYPSATMVN